MGVFFLFFDFEVSAKLGEGERSVRKKKKAVNIFLFFVFFSPKSGSLATYLYLSVADILHPLTHSLTLRTGEEGLCMHACPGGVLFSAPRNVLTCSKHSTRGVACDRGITGTFFRRIGVFGGGRGDISY